MKNRTIGMMLNAGQRIGIVLAEAFAQGKYKLDNLFISSKMYSQSLKTTLSDLQLKYLDLYLFHDPMCFVNNGEIFTKNEDGTFKLDPYQIHAIETWREIEKIKETGPAKRIGLSNFKVSLLNDLCSAAKYQPEVLMESNDLGFNSRKFDKNRKLEIAIKV
ncbi:MAG: hypothetical protein EZS28_030094 [Streblomastix strix]|uniref:NADP-dependent oxidoreductase domain-containing protein n=1 Tax=Streblomastix strix TaxID=222440 RepID=A0A5J4UVA2_9EUKA|nr:MAG: hypothetical protein EZS28_030094 [Streblomastix strix]